MRRLTVSLACQNSDRTRPILDGRVPIEGCDPVYVPCDPEEIFHRAFRNEEFDVCELSMGTHLTLTGLGRSPFVGVPAFVSRAFRHSAIYVRTDRGIRDGGDLAGRMVGVPDFQQTAGIWTRGMLADEYGVQPSDVRWRTGGLEQPGRAVRVATELHAELDLERIGLDQTLSGMLAAGELDAVIAPRAPSPFLRGDPHIGRLFPDYRGAEEAYFQRTGIFPIMHCIGVRRSLAEAHPWLATNVYKAFLQAKATCMQELAQINFLRASLPWLSEDVARVKALMGEDYWRYGLRENERELEALIRYAHADGLTSRQVEPGELFAASSVEMFRI